MAGTVLLLLSACFLAAALSPFVEQVWVQSTASFPPDVPAQTGVYPDRDQSGENSLELYGRWDCEVPIPVVVNLDHGPAAALEMATWAIGELREASGLDLEEPVVTDHQLANTPTGAIWIGWLPATDAIWESSQAVGLGGPITVGPGQPRIVRAHAIVRAGAGLSEDRTEPTSHQLVLLHELVHAIGLGHVDDASALMFESTGARSLNSTDLAAIALIGCDASLQATSTID